MKKIIALLLFTTFGYSQTYTPVRSTLHDNIKLKTPPTVFGETKYLVRNSSTGQVSEQTPLSVPDASETVAGKVSVGTQTFGGNKTIVGESSSVGNALEIQNLSHENLVEIGNNKEIKIGSKVNILFNRASVLESDSNRFKFTGNNITSFEIYPNFGGLWNTGYYYAKKQIYSDLSFTMNSINNDPVNPTFGNTSGYGMYFPNNNFALGLVTNGVERLRINSLGQIIIGGTTPNASVKLQIDSTTQGFAPPRMTTTQKNAIATPMAGLMVFDTTLMKLCVFTTVWETITSI